MSVFFDGLATSQPFIHEIKTVEESDLYGTQQIKNRWYVFDVDNTIFTPDLSDCKLGDLCTEEQATDGYFYQKLSEIFEIEVLQYPLLEAKKRAYRKAQDVWNATVQRQVHYRLLEKKFPFWIQDKVNQGAVTLALTAREMEIHQSTIFQLRSLGVNFSELSPYLNIPFLLEEIPIFHPEKALFQGGVFFVGRGGMETKHHKGKRFLHLLSYLKEQKNIPLPKEIFFFDDRLEHVEGMVEEMSAIGITCYGFHYTQIEAKPDI